MSNDNTNDADVSSTVEEIQVDWQLAQMLALARFSTAKAVLNLERLVPVRHVYSCERCGAPVARVRLAGETRTVDCFRDEFRSRDFAPAWNGNVCSEHECMGCHQ